MFKIHSYMEISKRGFVEGILFLEFVEKEYIFKHKVYKYSSPHEYITKPSDFQNWSEYERLFEDPCFVTCIILPCERFPNHYLKPNFGMVGEEIINLENDKSNGIDEIIKGYLRDLYYQKYFDPESSWYDSFLETIGINEGCSYEKLNQETPNKKDCITKRIFIDQLGRQYNFPHKLLGPGILYEFSVYPKGTFIVDITFLTFIGKDVNRIGYLNLKDTSFQKMKENDLKQLKSILKKKYKTDEETIEEKFSEWLKN